MNEKHFKGDLERLRAPERMQKMEADRAANLCLNGQSIGSILDIGTGTGIFAEAFLKQNKTVIGLDINQKMLEFVRKFLPKIFLIRGIIESLPVADKSVDLVFMGHVLHETDAPEQTLSEAKRVARRIVSVLEWPYHDKTGGPPIEHRLKEKFILQLGQKLSFSSVKKVDLSYMVLYLFFI